MSENHGIVPGTQPLSAADEAAIVAGEQLVRDTQAHTAPPPAAPAPEPPPPDLPVSPEVFPVYRLSHLLRAARIVSVEDKKVAVDLWPGADDPKPQPYLLLDEPQGKPGDWLVWDGKSFNVVPHDFFVEEFIPA